MIREANKRDDLLLEKSSEDIAYSILKKQFTQIYKISESRRRTPDFDLGHNVQIEIYCPKQSETNAKKVATELESQTGISRVTLSYPITGSDGLSLKYPANKTIDRVLNAKWDYDQFDKSKQNILWIDLKTEWRTSVKDCQSLKSVNHGEETYVGMFGIWHAFYGCKQSVMFRERTVVKYLCQSDIYGQQKEGYFRSKPHVSAALILCIDGLIYFENPWATNPLDPSTLQNIFSLDHFRPDFSIYSNCKGKLEEIVEHDLTRIEFLTQGTFRGEL